MKESVKKGFGWCFGIGIAIILFSVLLISYGLSSSKNKSSSTSSTSSATISSSSQPIKEKKPEGKVEIKSESQTTKYSYTSIVGEVVNNTDSNATFVKITGTFYDSDGKVVDTAFTYAGNTASTPLKQPILLHLVQSFYTNILDLKLQPQLVTLQPLRQLI